MTDKGKPTDSEVFSTMSEGLKKRAHSLFEKTAFSEVKDYRRQYPSGFEWVQITANQFLRLKEYKIAEHFYRYLLQKQPHIIMAHAGMGTCAFQLGRFSKALKHMHRGLC